MRGPRRRSSRSPRHRSSRRSEGVNSIDTPRHRNRVMPRRHHGSDRCQRERVGRERLERGGDCRRVAQIPRDAMDPGVSGSRQPAYHVAFGIADRQDHRRILLGGLGAQVGEGGIRHFAPLLVGFLLPLVASLLLRLDLVLQVVREDDAERRIRGREERVSLERLSGYAKRRLRHHDARRLDREEDCLLAEIGRPGGPERRVVVEDVEPPSERRDDQIVLPLLDRDVADFDRGEPALQLDPVSAPVLGEEQAELGPGEEEVPVDGVFLQRIDGAALGQVARDRAPGRALVVAPKHVGAKSPILWLSGCVDRVLSCEEAVRRLT